MTVKYQSNGNSGVDYFVDDVLKMTIGMEGGEFGDDPLVEVDSDGRCHVYVIPHDDTATVTPVPLLMYSVSISNLGTGLSHCVYTGGDHNIDYDCPNGAKFRLHIPRYIPAHYINFTFNYPGITDIGVKYVPTVNVYRVEKHVPVTPAVVSPAVVSDVPVVSPDVPVSA